MIIRRQQWSLEFADLRRSGYDGYTDHKNRRIVLAEKPIRRSPLDLLLHELLHAEFPDLNEQVVAEVATDLSAILAQLGYRNANQPS